MNTKLRTFLFVLLAMGVAGFTFSRRATTEPLPAEPRSAEAVTGTTNITLNYQGQLNNGTAPVNGNATFIFKLYGTLTGGTECWSETQTLNVQNGLFNALLGSVTAIPDSCVVNDTYLELVVNNTTLTPRELVNQFANTLPHTLSSKGDMTVTGNATIAGHTSMGDATAGNVEVYNIYSRHIENQSQIHMPSDGNIYFNWHSGGGLFLGGGTGTSKFAVDASGNGAFAGNALIGNDLAVVGWNLKLGGLDEGEGNIALRHDGTRTLHLLPYGGSAYKWDALCIGCGSNADLYVRGNADFSGNLNVGGTCSASVQGKAVADATCGQISANSVQTGAVIEANLQTDEEKAMARIERFEQGDVLCWSSATEQSDLCSKANSKMIAGIANENGKPAIAGVEPIKVLGPVHEGDLLVASDVPGYAMVNNNATIGTVIAKAFDNFEGKQGLIRCKIISQ